MNDAQRDEVLRNLASVEALEAAYEVTTFRSRYRSPDGRCREVTIEVLDFGRHNPSRWMCSAMDEDGQAAAGNPSDDLSIAVGLVHWGDLNHRD